MISHVLIENFKSIEKIEFDCKKVNIFIGPPGAGKSNILEAIGLFSLKLNLMDLRVNEASKLFYMHDISRKIKIQLNNFHVELAYEHFKMGNDVSTIIRKSFIDSENFTEMESILKKYSKIIKFYKFKLEEIKYLREDDLEYLECPYGKNMIPLLKKRKDIMKFLNENLFKDTGLKLMEARGKTDLFLVPVETESLVLLPLSMSSDGILRYIFNLLAIETNKNSIIILEEPESNIFPFYVRDLAHRIAKSDNQYFISTHNPYFIESLLEFVDTKDLAIFWTEFKGKTIIKEIKDEKLKEFVERAIETDVFSAAEEI